MAAEEASFLPGDESLFRLLVKSVRDYAIFALDTEGRVVSWNIGAQRIKGYTAEEALGMHFSAFFPEEDRASGRPQELLDRAAVEGSVTDEGWRVRKDGTRFRASVVISALRTPTGELAGFAKVTRDVTEPYAAQEALRHSERQLRDTQSLAGLGSWVWEVEPDVVRWTDKLYEIHGLKPEDFEATFEAHLARIHPEDRDRVRAAIEDAYARGGEFSFEERIVRPDGEVRYLRSRGRAIRDDSGQTVRLMGACLDITDLRQAQEKAARLAAEQAARAAVEAYAAGLRFLTRASRLLSSTLEYEETLRNVSELAVPEVADWCAIDLLDGDNKPRRVAVHHTDPQLRTLRFHITDLYPHHLGDGEDGVWTVVEKGEAAYHPEITDEWLAARIDDPERLEQIRMLGPRSAVTVPLAGRNGALGALTLIHAESDRRFSEQDLWLMEELGRHAGLAIDNARLHRDLERQNELLEEQAAELEQQTEELQNQAHHLDELMAELEVSNEELLQRTEEAEAANRAKSDFLATMSHELRTPLNAIFGYADLLDLGLHGPITPAQHEALERIKRNQRALLVLVNDVLNFAKLEAGKLELTLAPVPVTEVVADVGSVVGPQLEAKGLRYHAEPVDAGLLVLGERERIEQILLNLLTNAGKFTSRGGEVVISNEADEDTVKLHVRDTGSGIPESRLQSVFDPFVQIDRQVEDTGERGVGLGLAISRDLAQAMGGTLTVQSKLGVGSTFTLALPRVNSSLPSADGFP
ncbi:MAG TPA: PAS domain S-box protein [Longimicrobiaceae bacterium]